jgi:cell wall-associated NlpC family hydrolase
MRARANNNSKSASIIGWVLIATLAFATACGGSAEEEAIDIGEDDEAVTLDEVTAVVGQRARVTAESGLRLRTRPTTSADIILVMPYGSVVNVVAASSDWFSVNYNGTVGWAFGGYLTRESGGSSGGGGSSTPPSVQAAMDRARSGVGFSYWWGGGCWDPGSSSHGACYGSCPDCSHSGRWGADCSGFISKVWQVPGQQSLTSCSHPYSSYSFYGDRFHWSQVSRGNAKRGDAFVRQGHIFLFDGGDPWGSMKAYEAKGCRYGIIYGSRTADSSYRVIRRDGF